MGSQKYALRRFPTHPNLANPFSIDEDIVPTLALISDRHADLRPGESHAQIGSHPVVAHGSGSFVALHPTDVRHLRICGLELASRSHRRNRQNICPK